MEVILPYIAGNMCSLSSSDATSFFTPFAVQPLIETMPQQFTLMRHHIPHPLCTQAALHLQQYLQTQQEWHHNFGLASEHAGTIIGKMFGVLVVQTPDGETGYIAAFSGKLAGTNQHRKFVPPVFDSLADGGFLKPGMEELAHKTALIKQLQTTRPNGYEHQIKQYKTERKALSNRLQQQLFDHYHCVNAQGASLSVQSIFETAGYKNPPAGAAECATPKLLQYAFLNNLKPLAVAEFWWGQSPKSDYWKHGVFYPCCKEKCEPILAHMLSGLEHTFE